MQYIKYVLNTGVVVTLILAYTIAWNTSELISWWFWGLSLFLWSISINMPYQPKPLRKEMRCCGNCYYAQHYTEDDSFVGVEHCIETECQEDTVTGWKITLKGWKYMNPDEVNREQQEANRKDI